MPRRRTSQTPLYGLASGLAVFALLMVGACQRPGAVESVRGVLLEVEGTGFAAPTSFRLRSDDGRDLRFKPAPNFNTGANHAMSPGHMRQHMGLAEAVVVTFERQGSDLVALSVSDAHEAPGST